MDMMRQKPPNPIGTLAAPRHAAKLRRIDIAAQRHGYRHGKPPWFATVIQTLAL
jgi:hypothetical protein